MTVEIWVINILKIVFVILAGHIAITKIIPLLNDFLVSFVKNDKAIDSFTSLIDVFILVIVGLKVIEFSLEIQNYIVNYIEILQPAFEIIFSLFTYIQWILLVLIAVVAVKNIKN